MFTWNEVSPYFRVEEIVSPETWGMVHLVDVEALKALNRLRGVLGVACLVNVPGSGLRLRGLRSWKEQEGLVEKGLTKAKFSMHCLGKAFDVSAPGRELDEIANAAKAVGFSYVLVYPGNGFVHMDMRTVWRD